MIYDLYRISYFIITNNIKKNFTSIFNTFKNKEKSFLLLMI